MLKSLKKIVIVLGILIISLTIIVIITLFNRINNPGYKGYFSMLVEDPFKKNEENSRGNNFIEDIVFKYLFASKHPALIGMNETLYESNKLSYGAEFTHTKASAPGSALQSTGFERLEFTDGHNIITLNINRRWNLGEFNSYSLVGLGIAMPHVDALPSGGLHTFEYQYTGPALRAALGLSRKLNENFSIFTEYQFTASDNKVSLLNGGTLNTKLLTNAVNVGLSYNF